MARGKHGEMAANRRYQAAIEHIDRLTTEMATLKQRTKAVEAQAAKAVGLQAEVDRLRTDPVLAELVDKLRSAFKDRDRQFAAWKAAKPDFVKLLNDACPSLLVTPVDRDEFFCRRYPKLLAFLNGNDAELIADYRWHTNTTRRLGDEAATRLERAIGLRGTAAWAAGLDMAEVANDACDVARMELSSEERRELMNLDGAA